MVIVGKRSNGKMIADKIFCIIYYSDLMSDFVKAKNFKMVKFCSLEITRLAESLEEDLKWITKYLT